MNRSIQKAKGTQLSPTSITNRCVDYICHGLINIQWANRDGGETF